MNYKNKLNQIRVVLGLQVKLATAKLKDGTVVEAEEFVPGAALVVVAEDGSKSPAPAGEHTLEDGSVVLVDESGAIVSLKPLEAAEDVEEEVVEEEAKKVKMEEDEEKSELPAVEVVKEIIEEKIEEAMKKVMMAMEPLVTEMADMKSKMAKMEESYAKFAKAPAAGKITTINDSKMEFNQSTDIVDRFKELKKSL